MDKIVLRFTTAQIKDKNIEMPLFDIKITKDDDRYIIELGSHDPDNANLTSEQLNTLGDCLYYSALVYALLLHIKDKNYMTSIFKNITNYIDLILSDDTITADKINFNASKLIYN